MLKFSTIEARFHKTAWQFRAKNAGIFFTPGREKRTRQNMASINFGSYKVDIVIHNIDGIFSNIFGISIPKRFWVLLTVENLEGEKETFPLIDDGFRIKTFDTYEMAIDDIASLLKKQFTSPKASTNKLM
jgi:hypothetical protein